MSSCRPPSHGGSRFTQGRSSRQALFAASLLLAAAATAGPAQAAGEREYQAQFLVQLRAGEDAATARIRIVQPRQRLKRLRLQMPEPAFSAVRGDGRVSREGDVVTWEVPARGGELRYETIITHRRNDKGYDALVTGRWAMFRLDDVFPPAAAVHTKNARGRGEVLFDLPPGWTSVSPYPPDADGRMPFVNPKRRYARPVGWALAGHIGARMDVIGPTTVRIAAPRDQGAPRVPMLALIRTTLPVLQEEVSRVPPYLLILTAGDPMWRGGLSAPNSFFIHADRPLISENGTSTLVHELLHVLAPVLTQRDHDWIDEGLAEYLGLVVLQRGQLISPQRFDHAIATFRRRGAGVASMVTPAASGPVTARAVAIFHDLDQELRRRGPAGSDIFELLRRMMQETEPLDIKRLRALAADIVGGKPVNALAASRVPGET